jgi:hypothetical protein
MFWILAMACDTQVAETVGGVPIDESVVTCDTDSGTASIHSHTGAAHLLNVAVCVEDACDLAPEPGSITQGAAMISLDCSVYGAGSSLRVRTLRLQ